MRLNTQRNITVMFIERQRGTIMSGIERTNRLSVSVMEMDDKIVQLQSEIALLENEVQKLKETMAVIVRGNGK